MFKISSTRGLAWVFNGYMLIHVIVIDIGHQRRMAIQWWHWSWLYDVLNPAGVHKVWTQAFGIPWEERNDMVWECLRWFETTHNIVTPVIALNQSEDHHHHHQVCCLLSWLLSLLYSPSYFHAHPPHVLSDTKVSFQSIRTWGPMGSHDPGDGWWICWGNYDDLTATSLER